MRLLAITIFTLCFLQPLKVYAQQTYSLGYLPGGSYSAGYAFSDNSSVVVGYGDSSNSGTEAFIWTPQNGMVGLGDLPGGSYYSIASGVSSVGNVVIGYSISGSGNEAFRWTEATGMVGLGDLPGGSFQSFARDISDDGSVIVGQGRSASGREAFRWTEATGMVGLGDLPGGSFFSNANAISGDGTLIAGSSESALGIEAMYWSAGTGMVGLGDLPGGGFGSVAYGMSSDKTTIVGSGTTASGFEAMYWSAGTGMISIGDLPGGAVEAYAYDASNNGAVIVGESVSTSGYTAFVWTAETGMVTVNEWLARANIQTSGWEFGYAYNVSDDGTVIIGGGTNPSGDYEAYLARVSPIGSGILNMSSVPESLGTSSITPSVAINSISLPMNGAHHRPLMMYDGLGNTQCSWVTSDASYDDDGFVSTVTSHEAGLCQDFADRQLRIGIGLGLTDAKQETINGGNQEMSGPYGIAEVNYWPEGTKLLFSLTGLYGVWDGDIKRGYDNAGNPDFSFGDTTVRNTALRLGLHMPDLIQLKSECTPKVLITPKTTIAWSRSIADGYTETGGGFPARFDEQSTSSKEIRMGAEAATRLNEGRTRLALTLEGVYTFDREASDVNGELIGLFPFTFESPTIDNKTSARVGIDLDHRITDKLQFHSSIFAATSGPDPDISGALGIKYSF